MPRFSFFHFFSGKCRVGLATRDEPMIYPWRTHDYPVTTRDISKKTRDFRGKPGNVQPVIWPVIYPWQPVIFSRVRMCPQYIENIWGIYDWQFTISILDIQKGNRFQNSDCESEKV